MAELTPTSKKAKYLRLTFFETGDARTGPCWKLLVPYHLVSSRDCATPLARNRELVFSLHLPGSPMFTHRTQTGNSQESFCTCCARGSSRYTANAGCAPFRNPRTNSLAMQDTVSVQSVIAEKTYHFCTGHNEMDKVYSGFVIASELYTLVYRPRRT